MLERILLAVLAMHVLTGHLLANDDVNHPRASAGIASDSTWLVSTQDPDMGYSLYAEEEATFYRTNQQDEECPFCLFGRMQEAIGNTIDYTLPEAPGPFPLMASLAEDRDIELLPPIGTGVVFTELNRTVAVSDVRLAFGSNTPMSVDRVEVPTSKFHASTQIARIDLWMFPFLNVYGIVGHTRSTGSVNVTVDRFPFSFSPPITIDVPVDLKGTTYGWGFTTGFGGKRWFAMLDYNKTWTDFSNLNSELTAVVITPRVGVPIVSPCFNGEVHIGAMWQDTDQTVDLTIHHPVLGPGLHVQVDQFEPRPWNFLIGGMWAIDERLQVLLEVGSGGRNYVVTGMTLRF